MKNIIIFLEQMSKSVIPHKHSNRNSGFLKSFRFVACVSIVLLFTYKSSMSSTLRYILLFITYSYMLYQCTIITKKIYRIHRVIIKNKTKIQIGKIRSPHIRVISYIVSLFIIVVGLPFISDTLLEILGDIKYIIKQMLEKKKK
jgi:uncharacterized membrane protein